MLKSDTDFQRDSKFDAYQSSVKGSLKVDMPKVTPSRASMISKSQRNELDQSMPAIALSQSEQKNLKFIFQFYSQQSYYAMGTSPTFSGIDFHTQSIRLPEMVKVFKDFNLEKFDRKTITSSFTRLARSRGNTAQIDFEAF